MPRLLLASPGNTQQTAHQVYVLQLVGLLGALPWVRGRMPRQAKSTKVKLNAKAMQFIKDHENDPKSGKELIHCARNMRTVKSDRQISECFWEVELQ